MNVSLIDVDGHSGFPNLALMKLSAWHKAQGDSVKMYEPLLTILIGFMQARFSHSHLMFQLPLVILTAENLPSGGSVFKIVSHPMEEATVNGDGEENCALTGVNYNCTQIFRKEIVLSGSALAVGVFGNTDNQLNRQTAVALADLSRDLNRVALFGRRIEAGAGVRGEAGGLYAFATGSGALEIDAQSALLDSYLVNDAAQLVMAEGGEPMQILCSPGQARVISCEYKDRLQVLRSDDRRGAYVAVIINEINGRGLTVMADPDVPDTDCWLIDPSGFGLSNLRGRAITDSDSTPKGFDGIRRTAIGELTFEFKNAKQRCCRIKNLQPSCISFYNKFYVRNN